MKSREEISKAVAQNNSIPDGYNLFEIYCFMNLKQLAKMYFNKQISKNTASDMKQKIFREYEKAEKQWEFEHSMFQEHIQHLKETEIPRVKLHKMLNGKDEYNKPITEESLCETLNVCMEIISTVFPKEFN